MNLPIELRAQILSHLDLHILHGIHDPAYQTAFKSLILSQFSLTEFRNLLESHHFVFDPEDWIQNARSLKLIQEHGSKINFSFLLTALLITPTSLSEYDMHLGILPPQLGKISSIETVSLRKCGLITFPETFTGLTSLNLSFNPLITLPWGFGRMRSLKQLILVSCELIEIPESLGQLTSLEELDLGYNQLTDLPSSFGSLNHLTELWLGRNRLKTFPAVICSLTSLKILSLYSNQISDLPEEISQLSSLSLFRIHDNPLVEWPSSLWTLPYLMYLTIPDHSTLLFLSAIVHRSAECQISLSTLEDSPSMKLFFFLDQHKQNILLWSAIGLGVSYLIQKFIDD